MQWYYQLHCIGRIRRYLDKESTKRLVHALVLSRLDGCNSLLYGLPLLLGKLQRVQNACARVILRRGKYEHVTPMLMELHWLPIDRRVQFKILVLTFKCLHGLAPQYLSELVVTYNPARNLRSADRLLLEQPRVRTKVGERAFSHAAPSLWNRLPLSVRQCTSVEQFKGTLKTHFFREHFHV